MNARDYSQRTSDLFFEIVALCWQADISNTIEAIISSSPILSNAPKQFLQFLMYLL